MNSNEIIVNIIYKHLFKKEFNQIEDNLYLETHSRGSDRKFLKDLKIKRVLTVMNKPIEQSYKDKDINHKFICVLDDCSQDLLSHFPETNQFMHFSEEVQRVVICLQCNAVIGFCNKYFQSFKCNCVRHKGIDCLKIQVNDKNIKIQFKIILKIFLSVN